MTIIKEYTYYYVSLKPYSHKNSHATINKNQRPRIHGIGVRSTHVRFYYVVMRNWCCKYRRRMLAVT